MVDFEAALDDMHEVPPLHFTVFHGFFGKPKAGGRGLSLASDKDRAQMIARLEKGAKADG